jgi:DNA polymerase-3 subunit delta'
MSLAGVIGNRDQVGRLWDELARRPAHGYLLAGPRGIGKALIAHGFAHGILCEKSPGRDFCCAPERCPVRVAPAPSRGRAAPAVERCACCAACVQIAAGVHPDFNHVARAANRTDVLIEQVRNLIDRLGIRPSRGPRRVAIIDDAETLNIPAQNALLKTLEEPPGATIVFLITANERALLDTIRSRLRSVRFAPLEAPELAQLLSARAGISLERAGALARIARGSVRRALELVEGTEPPAGELLSALSQARTLDFARAQTLAQQFFSAREQAADNFELIARLLEEMLCSKLLRTTPDGSGPQTIKIMTQLSDQIGVAALTDLLDQALRAREAIEAMANSRLQAEQWWMAAGAAFRGEHNEGGTDEVSRGQ